MIHYLTTTKYFSQTYLANVKFPKSFWVLLESTAVLHTKPVQFQLTSVLKCLSFLSSLSGIVSLISLVVLSYDRYNTLTVYHNRGPDYRKPLLAVGGSWLYSLIWTVPPLLGWSSYGLEGAGTSCSVSWTESTAQSHAYIICLFIFCLGLPVLIMVYCYARLLYAVKQVNGYLLCVKKCLGIKSSLYYCY